MVSGVVEKHVLSEKANIVQHQTSDCDDLKKVASTDSAERPKYTLFQAIGFNTMNMFGTGPLITIPYCINAVSPKGPQAMIGYSLAVVACCCDSLIWSEIATMWPQSGGSYIYLRQLYGPKTWGKLASFMFIWQFFVSGPAEVASGFIAIAEYMVYFNSTALNYWPRVGIALFSLFVCSLLLFRGVHDVGRVTLVLWAVTIFSIVYTLGAGFTDWDPQRLEMPENALADSSKAVWAIAAGTRFGVYDMSGYYDVCFMGGEVVNPRRTIPISCVVTCLVVGIIFLLVYIAVLGHLPWQMMVELYSDSDSNPVGIMSLFAESRSGKAFACVFTIVVAMTIFGSVFAVLVGFGYLPYAAAKDGTFFEIFAHESKWFPGLADYSLGIVVLLSGFFCFFSLELVVDAMTTMIVLVMFVGQSVGLLYYRYTVPKEEQQDGWRMPLFPLPCIVQIVIFLFIWISTDSWLLWGSEEPILELSMGFIFMGLVLFLMRARVRNEWPFADPDEDEQLPMPDKTDPTPDMSCDSFAQISNHNSEQHSIHRKDMEAIFPSDNHRSVHTTLTSSEAQPSHHDSAHLIDSEILDVSQLQLDFEEEPAESLREEADFAPSGAHDHDLHNTQTRLEVTSVVSGRRLHYSHSVVTGESSRGDSLPQPFVTVHCQGHAEHASVSVKCETIKGSPLNPDRNVYTNKFDEKFGGADGTNKDNSTKSSMSSTPGPSETGSGSVQFNSSDDVASTELESLQAEDGIYLEDPATDTLTEDICDAFGEQPVAVGVTANSHAKDGDHCQEHVNVATTMTTDLSELPEITMAVDTLADLEGTEYHVSQMNRTGQDDESLEPGGGSCGLYSGRE